MKFSFKNSFLIITKSVLFLAFLLFTSFHITISAQTVKDPDGSVELANQVKNLYKAGNWEAGKKLVDEGKKESVRSVIKFMANSIQSELFTKCMYNDRNYQGIGYMRAILNSFLLDLSFDFWQKCNFIL